MWQTAVNCNEAWRTLRRSVLKNHRWTMQSDGMLYDKEKEEDIALLVRDLTHIWHHPHATIDRAARLSHGVWKDKTSSIQPGARLIGPVWIGCGRQADASATIVGPAVLWDDPETRPTPSGIRWEDAPWLASSRQSLPNLRASVSLDDGAHPAGQPRRLYSLLKRSFDIVFSLTAICLTLPLYLPIALAIFIEDGWPIIFIHRRETVRGKEFPCMKFRSMRRDAEEVKDKIRTHNQADGPQFFMENDPRLTRTGRFIRKFRLDELPQFFNVLVGHMSVVGPRPSPFKENQFCPEWREIRLSVRPGITGLWQVMRTRAPGADFQEWIRYDIEYVENAGWKLDFLIIWKTMLSMLRGDDAHAKTAQKAS
jgi:lipopolysaccharide/colanic/teichoic acid biosynthesis glycosyltransferase